MSVSESLSSSTESDSLIGPSRHVIDLEQCGPITVYVEGDLDKLRDSSNIFLTVHDVGSSYRSWVKFTGHEDMIGVRGKSLFLHVSLPGQTEGAPDLTRDFPAMQDLGLNLVSVLDHLRISRVLLLGEGAGANIITRFALCHPSRVLGVVLLSGSAGAGSSSILGQLQRKASKGTNMTGQNQKNVVKYDESYRRRGEILTQLAAKISFDFLLLTGSTGKMMKESEAIHSALKPGLCSIIRLEGMTGETLLDEAAEKVADAVILFCQGLGMVPAVQRKVSRKMSNSSTGSVEGVKSIRRKISMEQMDIPDIRRLSLTSHNI